MIWWQVLLTVVLSYMLGNISWGRIISKTTQKKDITKLGSGNPGSTNMMRNFGLKIGVITLLFDALKGFAPALAAYYIFGHSFPMLYIAGLSAIVGHIFPVIFLFKGGKGIATTVGVFFAAAPITAACTCVIAFVLWLVFQYGSLSSFWCIAAFCVTQGLRVKKYLPVSDARLVCILLFCVFILTWFAERGNIQRLLSGTESKVDLLRSTKKKMKLKK